MDRIRACVRPMAAVVLWTLILSGVAAKLTPEQQMNLDQGSTSIGQANVIAESDNPRTHHDFYHTVERSDEVYLVNFFNPGVINSIQMSVVWEKMSEVLGKKIRMMRYQVGVGDDAVDTLARSLGVGSFPTWRLYRARNPDDTAPPIVAAPPKPTGLAPDPKAGEKVSSTGVERNEIHIDPSQSLEEIGAAITAHTDASNKQILDDHWEEHPENIRGDEAKKRAEAIRKEHASLKNMKPSTDEGAKKHPTSVKVHPGSSTRRKTKAELAASAVAARKREQQAKVDSVEKASRDRKVQAEEEATAAAMEMSGGCEDPDAIGDQCGTSDGASPPAGLKPGELHFVDLFLSNRGSSFGEVRTKVMDLTSGFSSNDQGFMKKL